jgi:5'-nucleotidase
VETEEQNNTLRFFKYSAPNTLSNLSREEEARISTGRFNHWPAPEYPRIFEVQSFLIDTPLPVNLGRRNVIGGENLSYPIEEKLVIGIASSALFDLSDSHRVYLEKGVEEYREFQRKNEHIALKPGVAFPFIKRLLKLNSPDPSDQPVEVVLLSKNDPDTGNRVFRSIRNYGLDIIRAAFTSGEAPYRYIKAFNVSLFLSADESDVKEAIMKGHPAGRVLASNYVDDESDLELRIAFDFDGIIVDDEAEAVFQTEGLEKFQESELKKSMLAHNPGPLKKFIEEIAKLQQREINRTRHDPGYKPLVRTAIVTARSAPSHERVITTLREWGLRTDETFFLGGMEKKRILDIFKPHLFFDDQMRHVGPASGDVPAVHVPFGIINRSVS